MNPTDEAIKSRPAARLLFPPLSLSVRARAGGPVLMSRRIGESEMTDLAAEVWQLTCLRQGFPDTPLDQLEMELLPLYEPPAGGSAGSGALRGIAIQTTNPAGKRFRCEFTNQLAQHTALEMAGELVAGKRLSAEDEIVYELCFDSRHPHQADSSSHEDAGISITSRSARLRYLTHPLAPLRQHSQPVGPEQPGWAPVFYTSRALEMGERYSRRGGNQQPPVETGALLIGSLCSCPESGEFYLVVTDALEAVDAESRQFSLEFSDKTWTRVQAILQAQQASPQTRAVRLVGQAHGHPFLPQGGAPPCDLCWQQRECPRHTCFVSLEDTRWCRAVFPRQPWHLCHVYGVNARGEPVHKLFGRRDGGLQERGFRVLPDFHPPSSTFASD